MAPMESSSIRLSFGGSSAELESVALSNRRGALRVLAREAEHRFGVVPGKYSFNSLHGKVDSIEKLQDCINDRHDGDGVCQIEIYEHEDGRILRQTMAAMSSLEERMGKRMEEALAGIRREVQVDMRHLANEQSELRGRLEQINTEALESRADLLEGEHELTQRLNSLTEDCLALREDALLGEAEMTKRVDKLIHELKRDQPEGFLSDLCGDAHAEDLMKPLEDLARELQDECNALALRDLESLDDDDTEAIRKQVRDLSQMESKPVAGSNVDVAAHSHVRVVELDSLPKDSVSWCSKAPFAKAETFQKFQVSAQADALVKSWTCNSEKLNFGSKNAYDAMMPFSHCTIAPKMRGSRSSPILPALK